MYRYICVKIIFIAAFSWYASLLSDATIAGDDTDANPELREAIRERVAKFLGPDSEEWRVHNMTERFVTPLEWLGDGDSASWAKERYLGDIEAVLDSSKGLKSIDREMLIQDGELFLSRARKSMEAIRAGKIDSRDMSAASEQFTDFFNELTLEIQRAIREQPEVRIRCLAVPNEISVLAARLKRQFDPIRKETDDCSDIELRGQRILAAYTAEVLEASAEQARRITQLGVDNIFFVGEGLSTWKLHTDRADLAKKHMYRIVREQSRDLGAVFEGELFSWFIHGYNIRMGDAVDLDAEIEDLAKKRLNNKSREGNEHVVVPGWMIIQSWDMNAEIAQ